MASFTVSFKEHSRQNGYGVMLSAEMVGAANDTWMYWTFTRSNTVSVLAKLFLLRHLAGVLVRSTHPRYNSLGVFVDPMASSIVTQYSVAIWSCCKLPNGMMVKLLDRP